MDRERCAAYSRLCRGLLLALAPPGVIACEPPEDGGSVADRRYPFINATWSLASRSRSAGEPGEARSLFGVEAEVAEAGRGGKPPGVNSPPALAEVLGVPGVAGAAAPPSLLLVLSLLVSDASRSLIRLIRRCRARFVMADLNRALLAEYPPGDKPFPPPPQPLPVPGEAAAPGLAVVPAATEISARLASDSDAMLESAADDTSSAPTSSDS